MITLAELTAVEETVKIGGKEYTVTPLNGRDYAKIQERIHSFRRDPIQAARELVDMAATPEQRLQFMQWAFDALVKARQVTAEELTGYITSLTGMCYCFFLSLRHKHADVSEEQAAELLEQLGRERLKAILDGMRERCPDATDEQIRQVIRENGDEIYGKLLSNISGLPHESANPPPSPTQTPEKSPSPGPTTSRT